MWIDGILERLPLQYVYLGSEFRSWIGHRHVLTASSTYRYLDDDLVVLLQYFLKVMLSFLFIKTTILVMGYDNDNGIILLLLQHKLRYLVPITVGNVHCGSD